MTKIIKNGRFEIDEGLKKYGLSEIMKNKKSNWNFITELFDSVAQWLIFQNRSI